MENTRVVTRAVDISVVVPKGMTDESVLEQIDLMLHSRYLLYDFNAKRFVPKATSASEDTDRWPGGFVTIVGSHK